MADGSAQLEITALTQGYPQYWIARPCRHWDAARNRRFRLCRVDGDVDFCGRLPGAVFDGDRRLWVDCPYGLPELARRASGDEISAAKIG